MNDFLNISHMITVIVALLGWLVVHRFSASRDYTNHKRKMQTEFLVSAYQNLANSANRPFERGAKHQQDMEKAFADIQLFGSKAHVQLVVDFAKEFAQNNSGPLDPLLNALRQDLRKELGFDVINSNVQWVRFDGSASSEQTMSDSEHSVSK